MELTTVLVVAAAFALLWAMTTFNRLIRRRNAVANALGSVDVMLKRRFDLVPNLVAAVSRHLKHEQGLLSEITALRARTQSLPPDSDAAIHAHGRLTAGLRQIVVAVEAYPDLKASQVFLHLQASLNETEEQLAASRRAYNAAVTDYNDTVATFPTLILATCMGWKRRPVFTAQEREHATPNVAALFGPGAPRDR